MTVKTTLSFTDRHHRYLKDKAVEGMIEDEQAHDAALDAMADEIRRRSATSREAFVDHDDVFAQALSRLESIE